MNELTQIFKMFDLWETIEQALAEIDDPHMIMPLVPMMIDYTAERMGTTSLEFVEMLKPVIKQVNEELGTIKIK